MSSSLRFSMCSSSRVVLFAGLVAAFSLVGSSRLLAQGDLNPSGVPAATMKSLDQIEPRTPIPTPGTTFTPPFVISQPGSYYLTGNLTVASGDAIQIKADNVSLDLRGFTISSTSRSGSGFGINIVNSQQNITVRNGGISGSTVYSGTAFSGGGFLTGFVGPTSTGVVAEGITVRNVAAFGFSLSNTSSVLRGCITSVTAGAGISAGVISDCVVDTAGGNFGIAGATVTRCRASNVSSNVSAVGISGDVVSDCTATCLNGSGISAGSTASNCSGTSQAGGNGVVGDCLTNCRGSSVSGDGIYTNVSAMNCHGSSTSGIGIFASQATNCQAESTSGTALSTTMATNCTGRAYGTTVNSIAIFCPNGTVSNCRAVANGGSAIALNAAIASGTVTGGGTVTVTNKYNMP